MEDYQTLLALGEELTKIWIEKANHLTLEELIQPSVAEWVLNNKTLGSRPVSVFQMV